MDIPANQENDVSVARTPPPGRPRRAGSPLCRVGLVVLALLSTGTFASACGGKSPGPGVVSGAPSGSGGSPSNGLLAFTTCMRTHGQAKMPEPTIEGGSVHLSAIHGSGFDPDTPQFTAASNACKHLLPKVRGTSGGLTITSP